jgi:NAD(P)-dependent dehydrogenase (short-subunit alcohol dehydrogenase family)
LTRLLSHLANSSSSNLIEETIMKQGAVAQRAAVKKQPAQHQSTQPGHESRMFPQPEYVKPDYMPSQKLLGKVALITGGDSGIGRAVAIAYALEGADVVIQYLNEDDDARRTKQLVERSGGECMLVTGDLSDPGFCSALVERTVRHFGRLDVVVNNAAEQHPKGDIREIRQEDLESTFRVNLFSMFHIVQAALPHMRRGASIINTASVTAYRGSPRLVDYSATKGAIVSMTRSLAKQLIDKGIYVNAVAPGPVWTPLIVSTFSAEEVREFGTDVPMGRAGQPSEIAPCYVFLASNDASYMTGQVLHPNGGEVVNG